MRIQGFAKITFAVLLIAAVGLAADTPPLGLKLKYRVKYADEEAQRAESHTILTKLTVGSEASFGKSFPKLELLALDDPRDGDAIQVRLIAEDGSVLSSELVYLPADSDAEFQLRNRDSEVTGSISRL